MKDFLFVSSNFGKTKLNRLEDFLEEHDLIDIADYNKEGYLIGLCSIRLPVNDPRLKLFISMCKENSENPFIRFDREYSKPELDKFEYLKLTIKTVGLENPKPNQEFDFSQACSVCGAGVIPKIPLTIPKNKMGKRVLDCTAHNAWLIFHKKLTKLIEGHNFSGISFGPAIVGKNSDDFLWGKIVNTLPKLDPSSKLNFNHSNCNKCENSGNFGNFDKESTIVYSTSSKSKFKDFNLTNEFFGEWEFSKLGGARLIIIKQSIRQFFINEKVKYLDYTPIAFN